MKFELEEDPVPIFIKNGFVSRGGSFHHFRKDIDISNIFGKKKMKLYNRKYGLKNEAFLHLVIKREYKYFRICDIHIDVPTINQAKKRYRHITITKHKIINEERINILNSSFTGKLQNIQNNVVSELTKELKQHAKQITNRCRRIHHQ